MKDDYILASVEWLSKIQNKDGGWGMYDHDPSRIVTTAEAVTALSITGTHNSAFIDGIEYLVKSANDPNWCQYHRHHAWTVYALSRAGFKEKIPERCMQVLQRSHMKGGWGHAAGEIPTIYPTFLGIRALSEYGKAKRLLKQSCEWLANKFINDHWSFENGKPSYAATSYAIAALTANEELKIQYRSIIDKATNYLLTNSSDYWPNENESKVSGDLLYNFHHFTLPWSIIALISAGVSIANPVIKSAIGQLYNKHYWSLTGGWAEEINHRPSVFGTSHTIASLELVYKAINIKEYLFSNNGKGEIMNNNVFIVHGHDKLSKLEVARFLEKINCKPIILEEQIESGTKTIFEKFREHANNASYAIVLMTPDDSVENESNLRRARQNVILELGFFVAKLGADNVCVIKKGNIEIPSDISGVLYLNIEDGGWKLSLAQKLKSAGLNIDITKLF